MIPPGQKRQMVIRIDDKHRRHNLKLDEVEEKAKRVLKALEFHEGELSLLIVDDEMMSILNKQYLNLQYKITQNKITGDHPPNHLLEEISDLERKVRLISRALE